MQEEKLQKKQIQANYGLIATNNTGCCSTDSSCCSDGTESNTLSLGCVSNLVEKANIKPGMVVVDLGSGPGNDVLAASALVGDEGKVVGVDFTKEMLELARKNTANNSNVEIVEGDIEKIPLPDNFADVIISNCVINLTQNKQKVFSDIYRVLKPGGRLVDGDIAVNYKIEESERNIDEVYCGCIGGALQTHQYVELMKKAGFSDVSTNIDNQSKYVLNLKSYPYDSVIFTGVKSKA